MNHSKPWIKQGYLSAASLRVLGAVIQLAPTTVREVADRLNRGVNAVYPVLFNLRAAGLIAFESGKNRTIRPCVKVEVIRG